MRYILASSLVLSSLFLPVAAHANQPSEDATATTHTPRISTGVVAPTLLKSIGISVPYGLPMDAIPVDAQIGLSLTVDERGQPQDIHVVKGINSFWNARVVEAVSKFHYRPGTIDNQAVPVDVNLTVDFTR